METELRIEARNLLEKGTVKSIIGFTKGSLKFTTTPLFIRNPDDVHKLVVNRFIKNNLAKYLAEVKECVGIVVKGCDSRSVVSLIQDKQINRDNVVILGIACPGMIDVFKVEQLAGCDRDLIDDISVSDSVAIIDFGGRRKEVELSQVLYDSCLDCKCPVPTEYDLLVSGLSHIGRNEDVGKAKIQELKRMLPEQRWTFWKEQFRHCIRCYACRQICPVCYCERCFIESSEPRWLSPMAQWQHNLGFQIIRTIHVAGRCTDCGECERACPQNIPLRSMVGEMSDLVLKMFNYQAGSDKNAPPFMAAYEVTEAEEIFR
jgi:ferredoxin